MDYNFISVGEFRVLEEGGLLLESGTYDGMYTRQDNTVTGSIKRLRRRDIERPNFL